MAARGIPTKTVERLCRYRRIVREKAGKGVQSLFSHDLAKLAAGTAAQVRRDLMSIGCSGSSNYGYRLDDLMKAIGNAIDSIAEQRVALVGLGHLGSALIDFVEHCCPKLVISAAFDVDPAKIGRVYHGVRVYGDNEIQHIIAEQKIDIAIVAVPGEASQEVVDELVAAGTRGILNFAPTTLRTPINVYIEQIDLASTLEKVAYFTRRHSAHRKER
jgi:redox-sensing transcriptional repressor